MGFLFSLVPAFIPPQFRKAFAFVALGLAVLAILGAAKCAYDRSVIKAHDAKREAQIAKADRKADAKAAEQRRADDALIVKESQEIKDAITAETDPASKRAAYYRCVQILQQARRDKRAPSC